MTTNRHAALMKIVAGNLHPRLAEFFEKLRQGKPDFDEALSIARSSGRLAHDDAVCTRKIFEAVEYTCLTAQRDREVNRHREDMRDRIAGHKRKADDLSRFARELERDLGHLQIRRGDEDFLDDYERLELIINSIDGVAADLKDFLKEQKDLFCGNTEPNRSNIFEQVFVRAMRDVWRDVTGSEPGIARTAVIRFAVSVWSTFNFDAERSRKNEPDLYAWFYERFDNVR